MVVVVKALESGFQARFQERLRNPNINIKGRGIGGCKPSPPLSSFAMGSLREEVESEEKLDLGNKVHETKYNNC